VVAPFVVAPLVAAPFVLAPFVVAPFVLRYRSTNGSQGRGLELFALRYLRANGRDY